MDEKNKIESVLRFNRFQVDQIDFKSNYEYFQSHKGKIKLEYDINGYGKISANKDKAQMTLVGTLFKERFKKNDAPFFLSIRVSGFFSMSTDQVNDIEKFQINATAILFPYVRAAISAITSTCEIPPVKLPPINVVSLFKNNKIQRAKIEKIRA